MTKNYTARQFSLDACVYGAASSAAVLCGLCKQWCEALCRTHTPCFYSGVGCSVLYKWGCISSVLHHAGVVLMQNRILSRTGKNFPTIPLVLPFPGCELGCGSFRERRGSGCTGEPEVGWGGLMSWGGEDTWHGWLGSPTPVKGEAQLARGCAGFCLGWKGAAYFQFFPSWSVCVFN